MICFRCITRFLARARSSYGVEDPLQQAIEWAYS